LVTAPVELLLFYLTLALAISFLCSIVEAVILSVTAPYIRTKEMEGATSAKYLRNLKSTIDRPLSAILTINTVAHTVGAAGVGAQAVAVFGEVYFGVISAILTLLILFFSEIIPKTIGVVFWKQLAAPSAIVITGMVYVSYPMVVLSELIMKVISKNRESQKMSIEEIVASVSLGAKEGVLEESDSKIISNLITLNTIKVKAIMTPRTVMVSAPEDITLDDFVKEKAYLQYSRIPVYSGNIDNVTGYILNSDVLEELADGNTDQRLKYLKRPIIFFYENFSIPKLLEGLLLNKEHIALIVNEHGATEGLATMENIIETILGLEIVDETDIVVRMQELAKKNWEIRKKNINFDNAQ